MTPIFHLHFEIQKTVPGLILSPTRTTVFPWPQARINSFLVLCSG